MSIERPKDLQAAVNSLRISSRRHQVDDGACPYCDREKAAGNTFHPSHDASENCQSGKYSHCSCGTCF